ncbi:hypothetical protein EVJ50_13795 [Synechococcus sp. RSCCF101]|uniref:hypothetical protein n=1 Tax=Synechococcus sp. RSCCF101 TaxID=2511069 RepID=UPI001244BDF5|nr:hypothetical protein [Synechococcus sp. RSCCF101]QEY33147.1 hypothetical protein EVJ50_13795 [Synechococcus sp. RSCCF101]
MALRRHRLPRFWLVATLSLVAAGVGSALWWEKQLPRRLEAAAARGDLEACLRYGEQMAALRWLSGGGQDAQAGCRRTQAEQLWSRSEWTGAIALQRKLAQSPVALDSDRERLVVWEDQLRNQAVERFREGDLDRSLALLEPLGVAGNADGDALGDTFREIWNRNQLDHDRGDRLVREERWWEALAAINRLDHPWWQNRAADLRRRAEAGIEASREAEEALHTHGDGPSDAVPAEELDPVVQRHLAAGMDAWQAFEAGCRELGGRIEEFGPESACRR